MKSVYLTKNFLRGESGCDSSRAFWTYRKVTFQPHVRKASSSNKLAIDYEANIKYALVRTPSNTSL